LQQERVKHTHHLSIKHVFYGPAFSGHIGLDRLIEESGITKEQLACDIVEVLICLHMKRSD
jgi:hypothetical protein